MRVSGNQLKPGARTWYFDKTGETPEDIPVVVGTVGEAIELIADKAGKSPKTVRSVVFTMNNSDGTVDVSAFGYLVRVEYPPEMAQYIGRRRVA